MDVPSELFFDEGRLSASGLLCATLPDPPLELLEHLHHEDIIVAQEDMQRHHERLNATQQQPTYMDFGFVRNFVDDVLLNALDEARGSILSLRGVPMEEKLQHLP